MLPATIVAGFMQHKRTFQLSFPRSAQLQNALDNTEDEKIWEHDSDPDPFADIEDYADEFLFVVSVMYAFQVSFLVSSNSFDKNQTNTVYNFCTFSLKDGFFEKKNKLTVILFT